LIALLAAVAVVVGDRIRRQKNRIRHEVAEREHAEKALRAWERRFRDLLESVQLVVIIIDLNSGISFCNDYALSISGWRRDEVMGRAAREFLDDEYLRKLMKAAESPEARSMPVIESAILTKSGERRRIQWSSTVLRDGSGRVIGFASLGDDVTELQRLRAETAIRESEERFRAIFQHAAVGVAQVALDATIVLANDQYHAILGYRPGELLGFNAANLTHPEDFDPHLVAKLAESSTGYLFGEKRCFRKDGSIAWVRWDLSLVRDQDNRPKHVVAVMLDVTERKHAEAALRESEERFRNMADTAPVMIWVAGKDKKCTFFNRSWLTFTGRTMAQELGDGWAGGVHPEDVERCMSTYVSAFDARRPFQMEYRMRAANGSYRWVRDDGVPRFEAGGVFAGYIGSCVDVTDAKRAHEEALARQKLETVGVLAGGVAHDFNNFLGSIVADSELALSEVESGAPGREELARINATALRAARIVRELMAYAGIEDAAFEPVNLSSLVEDMVGLLTVSISKLATVRLELARDLPAVRANSAQLRQVVLNLVTNAAESLGEEGGTITVTTSRARPGVVSAPNGSANGNYIRLEVADTGCGMSEDVAAKIFDPYFTTKFAGRGLGLAAVQGIMRRHGGSINLASTPGVGTRFEILLPAVDAKPKDTPAAAPPESTSETPPRWTVLLVEDEGALRVPVAKMLRKRGFSVIEASDGFAALEVFRANPWETEVVLLDMTLPGMSGREVLQELRRVRPDVKVILTTAYGQETVMSAFSDGEVQGFIRKPYRLAELAAFIQKTCMARS
jgi:PAS domain S-box-containing protein